MGEPVYRSEQVSVRLVNRGSTFASRFGRWLKAARGPFVVYTGACAAIALVLLGGMGVLAWLSPAWGDEEARRWILVGGLVLFGALASGLVPALLVGVIKSASPDAAEQLLPREPWSAYVLGATTTPAGLRLLLGREPRLEFFVRRGALTADQWSLVQRWLAAQDLLGG